MNETAPVADETEVKVRQAVEMLGYTPQIAARTLAGRKTATVGLLIPEIGGAFFAPMLRGIEMGLHGSGFDLLIYATTQEPGKGGRGPGPLGEHNTDGLLVFTAQMGDAEIIRLHQRGFPLVLLHRSPPRGLDIPCVTFENKGGTRRIIEHLIEVHGYRRIGFLAAAGNEDSTWRELGYREALEAHGIAFDPALVAEGGFDDILAQSAVRQWLVDGVEVDAIFAGDDEAGSGAIIALNRAGKRVPEDVAVVGFDDVPFSAHLLPPLTTVRAPIETAGRVAAEQLVCLIQTGEAKSFTLLPTELIVRQSCGCP